ncbi:MAG: dihydroorotase family protein [Promethearchaeota archaeon]|nr:MAG: dihydroorotase family protein [Candidatus Lokiarchaeota archaeon]
MILKNARIFSEGLVHKGAILIDNGIIKKVVFNPNEKDLEELTKKNSNQIELDCKNRLILPGIIDIHSHLRDMGQSEKETFLTGTKAAAFSGITTVFNMPNTKPPAITSDQVEKWIEKAKNNIFIDVGFIAGVPKGINYKEIIKIIELGVIGFKIYPLHSINGVDWMDSLNIQKILTISSKLQIPVFIHADWPLSENEKEKIYQDFMLEKYPFLKFHNELYPADREAEYVNFILENYYKIITDNQLEPKDYPIVHFCHISCINSYTLIQKSLNNYNNLKITFEITPHHLLLSNELKLDNPNHGKVLPPLRDPEHHMFLFDELKKGHVKLIGTDHAPHTLGEKKEEFDAPSGFPGFETYPLLLLDKVSKYELPLENFVAVSSQNPANLFNLTSKGHIREGYDADLLIVDKVPEYEIDPQNFKTKAKFTPYEKYTSNIQIWKVFLRGIEINSENSTPTGKIIKRML